MKIQSTLFIKPGILVILSLLCCISCRRGCTDPNAENYDPKAKKDNGSCLYPAASSYSIESVTFSGTQYYQITGDVDVDLTLTADKKWLLSGKVQIVKSAILTIQPGTIIHAAVDGSLPELIITQGAKIQAVGTEQSPIVFSTAAIAPQPGDWCGITINGMADINSGLTNNNPMGTGLYGGTNDSDNSGQISYVRIEYAGKTVSATKKYPALQLLACGGETNLDHCQVFYSQNSGFLIHGGKVNLKFCLATACYENSFEWDLGWRGKMQFIGIQQTNNGKHGMVGKNNAENNNASPISEPTISNVTIVLKHDGTPNTGLQLNSGTRGTLYNFLIKGDTLNNGIGVNLTDATTQANMNNQTLIFRYSNVYKHNTKWSNCDYFQTDTTNLSSGPVLNGVIGADNNNAFNPTILSTFFENVSFRGAIHNNWDWTENWSRGL